MQLANAKEQQQRWPAQVLSTAHTCSNVWRPMSLSVSGDTMMACLHRTAEQQLLSSWGGATSSANMPSLLRQHAQRPLPITLHVSLCTYLLR